MITEESRSTGIVMCTECGGIERSNDYDLLKLRAAQHKSEYPEHTVILGNTIPEMINLRLEIWVWPENKEIVKEKMIEIVNSYSARTKIDLGWSKP